MKHILAFFGAFNPPTVAHLELAQSAMEKTGRDGVMFVPSKSMYIRQDQGKDFAYRDEQRLQMLCAAAQSRSWMQVTDWEMHRPTQPRTYETLCHLREEGWQPALLMGSDKLPELEKGWLHVDKIAREFGIVCMSRGTDDCTQMIEENEYLRSLAPFIQVVQTPDSLRYVSSTAVRQILRQTQPDKDMLSRMVPAEIMELL